MKRSVSLLVVLAMIVTTFAGFATVAAQDEFVINFDAAFGIGAIAATPTAQEHTFFYTKGAPATAGRLVRRRVPGWDNDGLYR